MSLILAFETSAKAASVALTNDRTLIGRFFLNSGLTHSETLVTLAQQLLSTTKTEAASVDKVAVAAGPGSFTGIRIGIAAAEGFAWAAEKPVVGVSTLLAMALGYGHNGIICPVMDARRNELYSALFSRHGDNLIRLSDDNAIDARELADYCREKELEPILLGDGVSVAAAAFTALGVKYSAAPEPQRLPDAYGVALAAVGEPGSSYAVPNYLRVSSAERVAGQATTSI